MYTLALCSFSVAFPVDTVSSMTTWVELCSLECKVVVSSSLSFLRSGRHRARPRQPLLSPRRLREPRGGGGGLGLGGTTHNLPPK